MNLYLLKPSEENKQAWIPWYDKAFGFVVRAESELEARTIANNDAGYESYGEQAPWFDPLQSSCEILTANGEPSLVLRDFRSA